jgi:DSF synthase
MSYVQTLHSPAFPHTGGHRQLISHFDPHSHIAWGYLDAKPRPCFSPSLLGELTDWCHSVADQIDDPRLPDVHYMVTASATPGIFNLGGDLALFQTLIRKQIGRAHV